MEMLGLGNYKCDIIIFYLFYLFKWMIRRRTDECVTRYPLIFNLLYFSWTRRKTTQAGLSPMVRLPF